MIIKKTVFTLFEILENHDCALQCLKMNGFIIAYDARFIEQCYVGNVNWFLKEKHFRVSKVSAMLMLLNGALLSLLYQQNLFVFSPE